jgi:hypothetical protein
MVVGVQCVKNSHSGIGLPLGRLLLAVHRAVLLGHLTVHLATPHHAATALTLLAAHLGSVVIEQWEIIYEQHNSC